MSAFGEIQLAPSVNPTYVASSGFFTPAASATDIFNITGSASKTVRVLKIFMAYSNSATASGAPVQLFVVKRSTANSGGTSTAITPVPFNSTSAAATAVTVNYTANPTAGTPVGNVATAVASGHLTIVSTAGASSAANTITLFDADKFGQAITLNSATQTVGVFLNAQSFTGTAPLVSVTCVFQEV